MLIVGVSLWPNIALAQEMHTQQALFQTIEVDVTYSIDEECNIVFEALDSSNEVIDEQMRQFIREEIISRPPARLLAAGRFINFLPWLRGRGDVVAGRWIRLSDPVVIALVCYFDHQNKLLRSDLVLRKEGEMSFVKNTDSVATLVQQQRKIRLRLREKPIFAARL